MNIAVLLPIAPFTYGGGEKMANDLVYNFKKFGYNAKRYDTVFGGYRLRHITKGVLQSHLLRFDDVDLVVPLTPTNLCVNHNNVVPWLIGQPKLIYEFFDDYLVGLKRFGAEGEIIRDIIINSDSSSLSKLNRVYTISPRTAELFKQYNGVNPKVLILPLEDDDKFYCEEYGDYIIYHSRLLSQKRQHLAIEAMKYTKTKVKLLIAGANNHPKYVNELYEIIEKNNLKEKVKLYIGYFSDKQKFEWLSKCLAGFYLGEDEDYWAIVTTEVMMSQKPVIAPLDTGATKYVVQDGITGLQPEGTPQAIAEAMDWLYNNKTRAKEMGEAGNELIRRISPTWETVVSTLVGE